MTIKTLAVITLFWEFCLKKRGSQFACNCSLGSNEPVIARLAIDGPLNIYFARYSHCSWTFVKGDHLFTQNWLAAVHVQDFLFFVRVSETFAGSLADQGDHWCIIFSKLSCNSSFPNFWRYLCHIFQFFAKFPVMQWGHQSKFSRHMDPYHVGICKGS